MESKFPMIKEPKRADWGSNHARWKGDKVGKPPKHAFIKRWWGKANKCESANCTGRSQRYDWANISGKYLRTRDDYMMLCRSCHFMRDKRKSHCIQGHEFTPENTRIQPDGYKRACRACGRARNRRRLLKDPHKFAARTLLGNRVRAGKLPKPKHCSLCGQSGEFIDGHHEDYDKPLEVIWVCRRCHGLINRGEIKFGKVD